MIRKGVQMNISNKNAILSIWKIFAWLDKCRWGAIQNYNLICYARKDLTPSEKILTHWLCYITDRQMPSQRIWDLGGFVISELVYRYTREKSDISRLLFEICLRKYTENNKDKYYLICNSDNFPELLNILYSDSIIGNHIRFSSRYLASDLACMFRTLIILQEYDRDIIKYIASIIKSDNADLVKVAKALNCLTYSNAHQYRFNDRNNILDEKTQGDIIQYAKNYSSSEYNDFAPFKSKRLWAALRDYIKSPEFKPLILKGFAQVGIKYHDKWNNELSNQFHLLELPGDVWNNNPVFKNKLIGNYVDLENNQNSPEIMRNLYEQLKYDCNKYQFYPEQFDVTFDFIPRMCQRRNCWICFFGPNGISKLCNPNKNRLCAIILSTCGYFNECCPEDCEIYKNIETGKRLCKGPDIFKY